MSYIVAVKSAMKMLQNFVAFSEYMNFMWNYKVVCKWKHEIFWTSESRCHAFLSGKGVLGSSSALKKNKIDMFFIIIQISYDKISLTHCIFLNKSHWGKFGLPCESDIFFMCALLRSMTFYGHIFPWPLWPLCLARVLYISWPSWHTTTA